MAPFGHATPGFASAAALPRAAPHTRRATCASRPAWRAAAADPSTDAPAAPVAAPAVTAEALSSAGAHPPALMGADEVMGILPHRYPFLLVDKVVALEPGVRCVAVKGVSVNEPFFQGHFPDRPIMPGVLQVEALAQVGGICMRDLIAGDDGEKRDFFFGGVDNVRWRKPVVPGDVLFMEAKIVTYKARFGIAKVKGTAYVDGKVACEADLTLVVDVRGKGKK